VPELACRAVCEQAFQHPWTLLIEKPVGHTLAEARQIEQQAVALGARAYVALNRRFYGSTLQVQQALQGIDQPRLVTILDQEDAAGALAAGQPLEVVRHWMYANSIHLIDYFTQLCRGDHLATQVLTPWNPAAPGSVIAQLQFSSGDIGLYQAVWNAPGPWSVAVCTPPLRGELRPIEQLSLQRAGSRQAEPQAADPLDQQFKPGLLRQAQAAIRAARGQATTLPSLAEANRSMALVASIYGMA
jgi:predicted dehydrogenase